MTKKRDNYRMQLQQAQKRFLTYDQEALIRRCNLTCDEVYLYTRMLGQRYRICRKTGLVERYGNAWIDANSFHEVLTLLDWICDSREDRYITGRWINVVTQGPCFHTGLQEDENDPDASFFDKHPQAFQAACAALGGVSHPSGDIGYTIELFDGLKILVQLWHGDDEFAPRLRFLWDENVTRYIRYETTWYAVALLQTRLREHLKTCG